MFAAASTDTTRLVVPYEGLVTVEWLAQINRTVAANLAVFQFRPAA